MFARHVMMLGAASDTLYRLVWWVGLAQLYYVLGRAMGLGVAPVTVMTAQKDRPLEPGESHMVCLVELADNTVMMVDVVPTGSNSIPLTFARHYAKDGPYDRLKDHRNPLDLYRKIQRVDPKGMQAQVYNARGARLFEQGQYTEAIRLYSRALELNPANAEAWANRAAAHLKNGRLEQTLADCRHCLALNPEMEEAHNTQGVVLARQQEYAEALELFSRALDLHPDFAKAYNNRGCVYNKLEKYHLAIRDFHRALRLDRTYVSARVNRATAYRKLGKYKKAVAEYTHAINHAADCHQAYIYRGLTYALLDEADRARQDFVRAVELKPALSSLIQTLSRRFDLDLPVIPVPPQH